MKHIIHTDTTRLGKVEGDASAKTFTVMQRDVVKNDTYCHRVAEGDGSDENVAVMQKDVEAKGPYCHKREGMKQTTGVHIDTMRFGKVEGAASDENSSEVDRTTMNNVLTELRLHVTLRLRVAGISLLSDPFICCGH